jgi:serine protease Do
LVLFITIFSVKAPEMHLGYVRESVKERIVIVTADGSGGGTGFYVKGASGDTVIVTNKHVCGLDASKSLFIVGNDGSVRSKRILELSIRHDLCILEPSDKRIEGLDLSDSKPDIGDTIAIVGHPHLTPLQVSKGIYNGESEVAILFAAFMGLSPVLTVGWTDASAYPGNSGSPVVDFYGNVIGVLFAGSAPNVNMIVPLDELKLILEAY